MHVQRIGTGYRTVFLAARIVAAFIMLLGSTAGFSADDELPTPPSAEKEIPGASGGESPNAISADESIPAPSLGDESLPEPSADKGQEVPKNQVNRSQESDEVFLPTPNVSENLNYAPVGTPASRGSSGNDYEWQGGSEQRPIFSLYGGTGFKSYSNNLVLDARTTGMMVGASLRMLSLAQTVFVHLYGDVGWYSVGDVGSMSQVRDETVHLGGLLEVGVGRRFSLLGSLLRRQARVSAGNGTTIGTPQNPSDLVGVGEEGTWHLGVGAQWDFYVIPHGSVGVHFQMEQDLFMLTLAIAMEPVPRKKMTLNFNESAQ